MSTVARIFLCIVEHHSPHPTRHRLCAVAYGIGMLCLESGAASAQLSEIQVYTGEMAGQQIVNLTVHNNYIAAGPRVYRDAVPGSDRARSLTGGTEWAYGVNSWSELGVYLPIYTVTPRRRFVFDGAEMRVLLVVPHDDDAHLTYGANLALSYDCGLADAESWNLELRPIVSGAFGAWRVSLNPIIETDVSRLSAARFSPSGRVEYAFNTHYALALEEYAEFGSIKRFEPLRRQSHTLFMAADVKRGSLSLETGLGMGLTSSSNRLTFKLIISRDLPR